MQGRKSCIEIRNFPAAIKTPDPQFMRESGFEFLGWKILERKLLWCFLKGPAEVVVCLALSSNLAAHSQAISRPSGRTFRA